MIQSGIVDMSVKTMEIIPAIDIYDGRCVRLYQGDYESVAEYQKDPVAVARQFEEAGARRIHVVDLDAARGGKRDNRKTIRKIRRACSVVLQIGGGIRSDYDVEELIDTGVDRLVIGTAFARAPRTLEGWIAHYGNIFIAGIDARDGKVCIEGWERETKVRAIDLAIKASDIGVESIVYTNIAHDGTLKGPDIVGTLELARAVETPVILSGGIASGEDIAKLIEQSDGIISGVILGKSIYENTINLSDVIAQYGTGGVG